MKKFIKAIGLTCVLVIFCSGCERSKEVDQSILNLFMKKDKGVSTTPSESGKETQPSPETTSSYNETTTPSPKAVQTSPEEADNKSSELLPSGPKQDSDLALRNELNGYINCLNRSQPRARDSYARYLSWVDKSVGPTCQERYISYGLYSLYDDSIAKCQNAATQGREALPELPDAEKAAADLATCNKELIPLVKQASDYYNQEDYKDDNCAKAKELHPKLIATFENCFKAADRLSGEVDRFKSDLDRRELEKLEKQGPSFEVHSKRFLITANDLMKKVKTVTIKPNLNPSEKQTLIIKFNESEQNYLALDKYATENKEKVDKIFWGSAFLNSAKAFNKETKFLRREIEGGKPSQRQLISFQNSYNRMISDSNSLRF